MNIQKEKEIIRSSQVNSPSTPSTPVNTPVNTPNNPNLLKINNKFFYDTQNRTTLLRGINLSGATKLPSYPFVPSHTPKDFFSKVSFINHPFPIQEAHIHIKRIKSWGFNVIRFIITWEAIEKSPGVYDLKYFEYVKDVLEVCREFGVVVFLDPHQDCWSRVSGGSGAPFWTLELVGFDLREMGKCDACVLNNFYEDYKKFVYEDKREKNRNKGDNKKDSKDEDVFVRDFPKMIWPTNYYKLACATMFTLFFGGEDYAPRCFVKNGKMVVLSEEEFKVYLSTSTNPSNNFSDLIQIQEYLQSHFINSIKALVLYLKNNNCLDVVLGYDTLNEPSGGYLGLEDISEISKHQDLKMGVVTTALQSFLLGEGVSVDVDIWKFGVFGPFVYDRVKVNESGFRAWRRKKESEGKVNDGNLNDEGREIRSNTLNNTATSNSSSSSADHLKQENQTSSTLLSSHDSDSSDYKCIWLQHGLYDKNTKQALIKDYFRYKRCHGELVEGKDGKECLDWVGVYWKDYVFRYVKELRSIHENALIFLEPPVNEVPPIFTQDELKVLSGFSNSSTFEQRVVYAPHWYDGLTLMNKHFSPIYNVDYLGFKRGLYSNIIFALKFGLSKF